MSGLEGQLLGVTIQHEKPELEKQKSTLLAAEDELKIQLEGMEQKLLADLASSEGNILENKTLLISLNELKSKSTTVKEKLEEASVLQQSLDQQREMYRGIAKVGSPYPPIPPHISPYLPNPNPNPNPKPNPTQGGLAPLLHAARPAPHQPDVPLLAPHVPRALQEGAPSP